MVFNYQKLKGRIIEKLENNAKFMELMKWSRPTFTRKLGNESDWTANEIMKAAEILDIPLEEIHIYFFTLDVQVA